jgi:hypothetical protein
MKKDLQSTFTTPEQSKRLLELGVPEWTADCCFSKSKDGEYICEGVKHIIPDDFCVQSVPFPAYPCWSVGRLIELYMKAKGLDFMYFRIMSDAEMIDSIVSMFVENQNEFDFSKLLV